MLNNRAKRDCFPDVPEIELLRRKENNIVRLGAVVKSARKHRLLTQRQLAERLGITTRYLKAIENSGRKPSYDLLTRIIRELRISADDVFYSNNTAKQNKSIDRNT